MFTTSLLIATTAATIGAAAGYLLARPTIRRLRTDLAATYWQLTNDPLTALYNRAGLHAVHARTALIAAADLQLAVILADLDHFKEINDSHGHAAGDHVLHEVAYRLGELAHTYDGFAARLSGDEFAILIPLHQPWTGQTAELINEVIAAPIDIPTDTGTVTERVTASLGITVVTFTAELEAVALRQADIAMYHAKHRGGDQHAIYEPGHIMPEGSPRRGPRLRDLRREAGAE